MVSTRSKVRIISGKSPAIFGKELVLMKDLLEISCGLDVHKDKIVACILSGPIGKDVYKRQLQSTYVPGLVYVRVIMKVPGNAKAPLSPKAILI